MPTATMCSPNRTANKTLRLSPIPISREPFNDMRPIPPRAARPAMNALAWGLFPISIQLINGTNATYELQRNDWFALVVY